MKLRKLILFCLALLVFAGCRSDIIEKVATGAALSEDDKKEYAEYTKDAKSKADFDTAVAEYKKKIAENSYSPPTEEQKKLGVREYHGQELKISPVVTDQIGFIEGSRVKTPDGEGYFVGIDKDGDGWFHLDGKTSLHYYKGGKDEYIKKGFMLIASPAEQQELVLIAEKSAEEQNTLPLVPAAPAVKPNPAAPKIAKAASATSVVADLQVGEIEKLPPIPPIPPLKEK